MKIKNILYKSVACFCICFCMVAQAMAAEAEYKKLQKTFTLNADGSQSMRYYMELTLFTHTAMNSTYGESFIVYDPAFQELKINESYTRQVDGKIIRTPENGYVEVLPSAAAKAPAYNGLKEMVVIHTGLELGATIYLDYTLTSKAGYLPELDVYEELIQSSPVKEFILTLNAPASKTISYSTANVSAKPAEKIVNGMQSLTWTLRNLPASSRNPFVAAANGDVPYLAATTYASTAEALQALYKQFAPKNDLQLETIAETLTEGKDTPESQLASILAYVNQRYDFNRLSLEQTGYKIRPVSAVIESAYGTEAEKVNLLNGLLQAAGFKAEPVAAYRVKAGNGLGLKAIGELGVSCTAGGKTYRFVPNSTQPARSVFVADYMPAYSLISGELLSTITPDCELSNKVTMRLADGQLTTITDELRGEALLPYFSTLSTGKSKTAPLRPTNGYVTLQLEEAPNGLSALAYGQLNSERKDNLLLPRLINESYSYTIDCPANLKLQTPASQKTLQNRAGTLTTSLVKNGNQATVTRSIKLNKQLYTPAEYADLRELLIAWSNPTNKTLLFQVN